LPRSLFLKIFLWFGTAVLTFIVGTFFVGEMLHPEAPMRRPLDPILDVFAKDAAAAYERGGQAALVAYLDRVQSESHLRLFLFDSKLQELTGRRTPASAVDVARKVFETKLPQSAENGPASLIARTALTDSGSQYVLVAELSPRRGFPFHPFTHLVAMIFIGGLFCYWLARHLTSPVAKLRAATRELASGNLNARVLPALGKRRDELASLAADFDEMAEKIQTLVNSQRRLLGDISHELRSPLARLNVALELARQRSGAEATTALERIQLEAENLNEMIGQLLALTRLESGTEEIRKTEFDLAQLVRAVTDDADYEARSRKRSVKLETADTCTIVGNEQLLRRAIENVVRNAVQYTAEGTEVEVKLECFDKTSAAVITVRDHGAGVPESALSEIFRPFYRVEDARDREAGGVGLGLAIAERAVRLHDGKVEAANVTTGGLIVKIVLPSSAARNQSTN
jgi:two-component system sensor histidine kinase CpxA